jgi:tRNA(fMet)-specific endonuclease VapC
MKLSLDTNAYTKLVLGHRPLLELLEQADELFVSSIVLGELIAGFTLGNRYRQNLAVLRDFLNSEVTGVSDITKDVAERYALLFADMRSKGTPVPTNDLWIAAAAMETGSRLVTYDGHFTAIAGLVVLAP